MNNTRDSSGGESGETDDEVLARLENEEIALRRADAIEGMVGWFGSQFEDPEVQTPSDREGNFIYRYGGPFDAMDMLHQNFAKDYDEEWVRTAAERLEGEGTLQWAPRENGAYYDAENNSETGTEIARDEILDQIVALREQLSQLPVRHANFGHNQPPEQIGAPPYADEDRIEVGRLLTEVEEEISSPTPNTDKLNRLKRKLAANARKALSYFGSKVDLFIDESIKKGVTAGAAYLAFGENLQSLVDGIETFLHRLLL